jgi:hypothetical protein
MEGSSERNIVVDRRRLLGCGRRTLRSLNLLRRRRQLGLFCVYASTENLMGSEWWILFSRLMCWAAATTTDPGERRPSGRSAIGLCSATRAMPASSENCALRQTAAGRSVIRASSARSPMRLAVGTLLCPEDGSPSRRRQLAAGRLSFYSEPDSHRLIPRLRRFPFTLPFRGRVGCC